VKRTRNIADESHPLRLIIGSQANDRWEIKINGPNAFERSYTLEGTEGEHRPEVIRVRWVSAWLTQPATDCGFTLTFAPDADVQSKVSASQGMAEFAGRFLGGMYEDGAVLPTNLATSAPEVLALALLQHRTSPT
jgi:hypothetical protein